MHSILLVDDDPALLRMMQSYLERQGYSVDASLKPSEALEKFTANANKYDVVIADLTMHPIPGDEMGLKMVALNSRVRILLCSGYPYVVDALPADVRGRFAALQKPFVPDMLAKAVSALLKKA